MTLTATSVPRPIEHNGLGRLVSAMSDILAVTWRNLLGYKRVPQLLVFSTIQPVIFVLMFRYVFGGAITVPGVSYVDYLMPGIFTQVVVFGSVGTAIGLAATSTPASFNLSLRFPLPVPPSLLDVRPPTLRATS